MMIRRFQRKFKYLALPVFWISLWSIPALSGDVTLAWDPVAAANLSGYHVYYGSASRTYLAPLSAGTQTSIKIPSSYFQPGRVYYFAVTAYDQTGAESGYSNEVSKMIPTCDLTGDGSVNILDVQAMTNIILGLSPFRAAFDLNGDGGTSVLDLQLLSNVVLGNRTCP
jgi:hypothetical protein